MAKEKFDKLKPHVNVGTIDTPITERQRWQRNHHSSREQRILW